MRTTPNAQPFAGFVALVALGAVLASPLTLTACSSDAASAPGSVAPVVETPPDPSGCAEGFQVLEGNAGCAPILPTQACAAGTRAAIGSATCVPVGVTACAPGFGLDATGWGCNAIVSPKACAIGSGTRERLGSTACTPISDCSAPFPPAAATIFVKAAYADAELDATHFRTIAAAVVAAPAGATIAVDSGTYVGEVVDLQRRPVSIVGRCAQNVVIQQTEGVIGSGIKIGKGDDAVVKNVTLRGYNAAVAILGGKTKLDSVVVENGLFAGIVAGNIGTEVSLRNVVVRGIDVRANRDQAFGVFASAGATMNVEDSVLSANDFVNAGTTTPSSTLNIKRSIIREGRPFGRRRLHGIGVYAAEGATLSIEETAILDNSGGGVDIDAAGGTAHSSATINRSVIRGTKRDGAKNGRGIEVSGSELLVEQTTIAASGDFELLISENARVQLANTTLLGAPPPAAGDDARPDDPVPRGAIGFSSDSANVKARSVAIVGARAGAEIQGASKVDMADCLVLGTRTAPVSYENEHWIGLGLAVAKEASLKLSRSTVQDTRTIAVLVTGSAELTGTLVRGTRPSLDGEYGRALSVQNGGKVVAGRSAFVDNVEAGIIVMLAGSSLEMTDSTVQDTNVDATGRFGMGMLFGGEVTGSLDRCTITGSKGVGLTVAAAGAQVRQSTISRNVVGVHAQHGSTLMEGESGGDALSLLISRDTRFVENATRVGSGSVPLPVVLEPRAP